MDNCVRIVKEGNRHGELTNSFMAFHSKDHTLAPANILFGHKGNTACPLILDLGVCYDRRCVESSLQNSERGHDLGRKGPRSFFLYYLKSLASILTLMVITGATT